MKLKNVHLFLLSLIFVLFSFLSNAQTPPDPINVIGPDTVCVNSVVHYYVDSTVLPSNGTWWQVNTYGEIVNGTINSANVKWSSAGSGQLIYRMQNISNAVIYIGIKNVHVLSSPKPRITTDFKVACQKLGRNDSTSYKGFDTSVCIKVCAYNCITYYAKGDGGSTYNWSVFGGTISIQNADSCVVCWDGPGSGNITVEETNIYGCTGQQTYCVDVIESPVAHFVTLPDTTLRSITICDSTELIFLDKSTYSSGSPIVSWHWDFGDGTYSNAQGSLSAPVTHLYTGSGLYVAKLTVTNKCGCSTTDSIYINVDPNVRLAIECPRVVCENDTAAYSVNTLCTTGTWSVIGGTVLGTTPTSVLIRWDRVDPSGFGYVMFDATSCGQPCAFSTVKVPVVLGSGTIEGPTILCPNSNYLFSLPQWPSTTYSWSLNSGAMAYLIKTDQPNEIALYTATAESLTLTCNYYNTLLGCGGTATLNMSVLDPVVLSGPDKVCFNTNGSFTLTGTNASTGSWVLTDPNSVTQTGSGANFTGLFDVAGTYTLAVSGSFCPLATKLIQVDPLPPVPDTISGPDSFCKGVAMRFEGGYDVAGTVYNWAMDNGQVNAASGAATYAKMNLSSSGPFIIYLWRESRDTLHCHSDTITKQVYPPTVNNSVIGEDTPCVSHEYTYQAAYNAGEFYKWKIYPQTMGSVRAGDGTKTVTVLWNNAPGNAMLVCEMRKCFATYLDTLFVNVGGQLPVVYSGPSTVCGDDSFTVSLTNATGSFDFDDGTGFLSNGTGTYKYAYNGNLSKTATLKINVTTVCGLKYLYSPNPTITVNPTPMGHVSPALVVGCGSVNQSLSYTYIGTGAATPFTYQWYKDGVAISGATSSTYTVTNFGNYWIEVTSASPSCTWKSDTIKALNQCYCAYPTAVAITSATVSDCNNIYLTATHTSPDFQFAEWHSLQPDASLVTSTNTTAQFAASAPGYYTIKYSAYYEDIYGHQCHSDTFITVLVNYVPLLYHSFTCNDSAGYRETKLGTGESLFPAHIYNHEFYVDNVLVQSSSLTDWMGYLSSGSHTAKLRSSYNGDTCEVTSTFTVQWAGAAFKLDTNIIRGTDTTCEKEAAVEFINTSAYYNTSLWDFGDVTGNTFNNPARVYNSQGVYNVKLVVTDVYGCKDSVIHPVTIVADSIDGSIAASPHYLCPDAGVTITYTRSPGYFKYPTNYTWYNGPDVGWVTNYQPWIFGAVTGMWWLNGEDRYGCVTRTNADTTQVINIPKPYITGDQDACVNEPFTLNGYGGSDPNLHYRWLLNNTVIGSATSSTLTQTITTANSYNFRVIYDVFSPTASMWCSDTSTPFTVTVHPKPGKPSPAFSILDCNSYKVELTATPPSSSIPSAYNWSNGLSGSPAYTYNGGAYQLVYTDQYGCTSDSSFYIPKDPRVYLWIFPTGCWSICPPQKYTITGPIISFSQWGYLKNGVQVFGGSNNKPSDYLNLSTDAPGTFNLYLNNGYCGATSGNMIVDTNCTPVVWAGKPGRHGLSTAEIEKRLLPSLDIVPNPAQTVTKIVYGFTSFDATKLVEVYDVMGRLISRQQVSNIQGNLFLSLDAYGPGVYQVILRQNGRILTNGKLSIIK